MTARSEGRLAEAVELLLSIASGNLEARGTPSEEGDAVDALVLGLNMLAELLHSESEGRRVAEALLQDERDAYDRSPALLATLDSATRTLIKANRTLADALGRDRDALLGAPLSTFLAPEDLPGVEALLAALVLDGRARGAEVDLLTTDGARITTAMDVRLVGDSTPRFRVTWQDITERKRLEAQLAQSQKMEALGRLAGGVAHDFNNLLSIITSSAALALDGLCEEPEVLEQDLRLIAQAADRGTALTSDLLAITRRPVQRAHAIDLDAAVAQAVRLLDRLVAESVAVTLTGAARALPVRIDEGHLSQVLINVATNAADAMPDGGRLDITVEVTTVDELHRLDVLPGDYAVVSLTDTGTGMPEEVIARALEPFYTTKARGKGTGLGLATSYGLLRQAGGTLSLYSEVGRGTTVRLYLPLVETLDGPVTEPGAATASRGGETVLVVEDDALVRTTVRRVLERSGYTVLPVGSGAEALEVLAREGVQLVVTDVGMPEMDGPELAARIRERWPGRHPILFLSGYASTQRQDGPLAAEEAFLAKPFTPYALLTAVRRAIERG